MTITVTKQIEVEITALEVSAGVRYWEDAEVNGVNDENGDLIPCRNGDNWCPVIEIETGRIINWEKGVKANIHYKVCDQFSGSLIDKDGNVQLSIEDEYVPSCMSPGGDGYGDYIIMNVDENGLIENWEQNFDDFQKEED